MFRAVVLWHHFTAPQHHSVKRADHSTTASNGLLQHYSVKRAGHSTTASNGQPKQPSLASNLPE